MKQVNPIRSGAHLELDDKTFTLLWDFNAIAEAEDRTGLPLLTGFKRQDIATPTINLVRAMFFASVKARQPWMSYEDAQILVTNETLPRIWDAVMIAWFQDVLDIEGSTPVDPPAAQG